MTIEKTHNSEPAPRAATNEALAQPNAGSTMAPYRPINQIVRGVIAAVLMGLWGATLVGGIFLLHPDTRQPTGILMVLAVPILFVSALPIVYRYWVKNWQTM